MSDTIRWQTDSDGVVLLTLDDPTASANTLSRALVADLAETVARLQHERDAITGVVITSAKNTFFAGGDLNELRQLQPEDAAEFSQHLNNIKATLRAIETLGRPVVAALNGAALGGGLELALAAHHRIVADVPGAQVGLPEVNLGLLPALGGVTRVVRHLGVSAALEKVLLPGRSFTPGAALELGLVHEVVRSVDELLPRAKEWILANPEPAQPWDRPGFLIPGGTPARGPFAAQLPYLSANLRRTTAGAPVPAQRAVLAAAVEGAQVDLDAASLIETRYFVNIAVGQDAKNRIQSTFFDLQHIKSGRSRPAGEPTSSVRTLGVVGAGVMGAGIAYVAARAGIEVVLVDVDDAAAARGKAYAEKRDPGAATHIRATGDLGALTDADFVVEAVFENAKLKASVLGRVEGVVSNSTVLGSNTSTLPITGLAGAVLRPQDFVGVHFFSPVERMALVEIIKGEHTSAATVAKAFDLVRLLGKTPIVVKDGRGFFTSRVIMARLNEAVAAVGAGVDPASIEQAGRQAGYPAGPLQLLDELTLTLPRAIREQARAAAGDAWTPHPADVIVDRLIDEFGRTGRRSGAGLYNYDEAGRRGSLWPGLREHFPPCGAAVPFVDIQERLLFAEALEAMRAYESGVVESVADANVGSLLGIGFPAWTGGVLHYVEQYAGGPAGFAARCAELAQRYGERFAPPESLLAQRQRTAV